MSQITKRALEISLKNLLLQKPLNKITISDIANDCGINRMTFYYHFKDIYDLIEWICNEETTRAINGKKTYETWQQGFLQTFQMVLENKSFVLNVYHSIGREKIQDHFYTVTFNLLIGVVEEKAAGMSVTEADKKFIANFYNFAFVGILLDWIKNDMREDPQLIIDQISALISGDVSRALNKYQLKRSNQITQDD